MTDVDHANEVAHWDMLRSEYIDDSARIDLPTKAPTASTRRNSTILKSAWQESNATWQDENGVQCLPPLPPPELVDDVNPMDQLLDALTTVDRVVSDNSWLSMSEKMIHEMDDIRVLVAAFTKKLSVLADLGPRNYLESLMDYDNLPINLKDETNMRVQKFRHKAASSIHETFKDWHCPSYFSTSPLPEALKDVQCRVRGGGASMVVVVNASSTPATVIAAALKNSVIAGSVGATSGFDVRELVLKITGQDDFLVGLHPLFTFEHVRECVRKSTTIDVKVMHMPAARDPVEPPTLPCLTTEIDEESSNPVHDKSWRAPECVSIQDLHLPFRVRVCGVDGVHVDQLPCLDSSIVELQMESFLFHATHKLGESHSTDTTSVAENARWLQWMSGGRKSLNAAELPLEARAAFLLIGVDSNGKREMLAWSVQQLIDAEGFLIQGSHTLNMWPCQKRKKNKDEKKAGKSDELDLGNIFRGTTRSNPSADAVNLTIQYDKFLVPVRWNETKMAPRPHVVGDKIEAKSLSRKQRAQFDTLLRSDALYDPTPDDRHLLWVLRHSLVDKFHMLPLFLQSVDWTSVDHRVEAYNLLQKWAPPASPTSALELLDVKFADTRVREYAVLTLQRLDDAQFQMHLLQLAQCLKFESHHDSALSRMLVARAVAQPLAIGHHLFWHLKAEVHNADFCERYALTMESYLASCGSAGDELRRQDTVIRRLQRIAELVAERVIAGVSDDAIMADYHKQLHELNEHLFKPLGSFQIPLNPKLRGSTLIVEKCRYMSSKKVPLWLVFKNADDDEAAPIYVIMKSGDDLRQDILTLQLLKVMDEIWMQNNMDMRLKPYRVVATGVNREREGVGMIEVVTQSDTTSGIHMQYGGGARGAFKLEPIRDFIAEHNKTDEALAKATENFVRSCAGYCVATYVLGIGDRHNGNIMMTQDGHLFHIDFGHFLGNFKSKAGIQRERAAFVFTPEMAFVIGGKHYKRTKEFKMFKQLCCDAFNSLRKHGSRLESLFSLMVAAGMPELMEASDIEYLQERLCLQLSDDEASNIFEAALMKSVNAVSRRIDNWFHLMKHEVKNK